jgi:hypothetical protein
MNFRAHSAVVVAAVCSFALTSAGAQDATGSFTRTLAVDSPLELDVTTGSGSIAVRRGDSDQVTVVGQIRVWRNRGLDAQEAEDLVRRLETDPPIELSGNSLRIGYIEDRDDRRNVSISYEIDVPAQTSVRSRSGSGGQRIVGVDGPVEAVTGSGSVTMTEIGGAADARTGSGSINASGIAGAFSGRTGSGSVRLVQTATGDVEIHTGSGSSRVSGAEGALRVRTGSGTIEAEGIPRGTWTLETGSGSIRLRLPEDAGFDIDAQAGSGGVRIDHPVTGTIRRGRVGGTVRGGGPMVRTRTGSGGIRIE